MVSPNFCNQNSFSRFWDINWDYKAALSAKGEPDNAQTPRVKMILEDPTGHDVFHEFSDVVRPAGFPRQVSHGTKHYIRTTPGQPASARLKIAKNNFEEMIRAGKALR